MRLEYSPPVEIPPRPGRKGGTVLGVWVFQTVYAYDEAQRRLCRRLDLKTREAGVAAAAELGYEVAEDGTCRLQGGKE